MKVLVLILLFPVALSAQNKKEKLADGIFESQVLFSKKSKKGRKNLTVRISYDEGKIWTEGKTIYPRGSAYSSMTILKNGDIGLFFEKDGYKEIVL
jgi:sialidase-1